MSESPIGRDGYILAMGRKLYHVYKQSFPMEFWYGLTPEANRECIGPQIDVRTLPEKYRKKSVEVDWRNIAKRSMAKALRDQTRAHALAFANAIYDGYSLEDHVAREEAEAKASRQARAHALAFANAIYDGYSLEDHVAREEAEAKASRQARASIVAERRAAGLCSNCGAAEMDLDKWGECPPCAEVPF